MFPTNPITANNARNLGRLDVPIQRKVLLTLNAALTLHRLTPVFYIFWLLFAKLITHFLFSIAFLPLFAVPYDLLSFFLLLKNYKKEINTLKVSVRESYKILSFERNSFPKTGNKWWQDIVWWYRSLICFITFIKIYQEL